MVAIVAHLACRNSSTETPSPLGPSEPRVVPSADFGSLCADVGPLRACWDDPAGARPGTARLVDRTLPAVAAASPMGWRCMGQGPARACVDRARSTPPFVCADVACTQRHARMPDDGEWTCAEIAGAVVCAGGERAAGVAPGSVDLAWLCATRRGGSPGDGAGPRVCVDFAADLPDGNLGAWRCRQVNQPPGSRICERRREGQGALLTDPCDRARPCVDGAVCAAGRCLPPRPSLSCWLDTDCPRGACRFGSCMTERLR